MRHTAEFFAVLKQLWDDERRCYFIEQGLELGGLRVRSVYRDMLACRF